MPLIALKSTWEASIQIACKKWEHVFSKNDNFLVSSHIIAIIAALNYDF